MCSNGKFSSDFKIQTWLQILKMALKEQLHPKPKQKLHTSLLINALKLRTDSVFLTGGTVHLNSYSLIMHSLSLIMHGLWLDAFQAHASHAWNHKGATTRPSSTESVDSGDLKKDAV